MKLRSVALLLLAVAFTAMANPLLANPSDCWNEINMGTNVTGNTVLFWAVDERQEDQSWMGPDSFVRKNMETGDQQEVSAEDIFTQVQTLS